MQVAVTGSSGLIGSALTPALEERGHKVLRLVRRPASGAGEASWDPTGGLADPARLENLDAVVHLAGVGIADRRWSAKRKAAIYDSRVSGTRHLVSALAAKNIVRGRIGREWMAIRDMDIAAEIIGIRPLQAKLSAFAVSSFYVGMAGSLYFGVWLGAAEPGEAFDINQSFLVLFMVIIGGLGSVLGSFLGAGFLVLMPILLKNIMVDGLGTDAALAAHIEIITVGVLIIGFLIVEPHGLARLWRIGKEKLRLWPFPH